MPRRWSSASRSNPDGRLLPRATLLTLAQDLRRRGGVLVIDEAFMDVGPPGAEPRRRRAVRECCCAAVLRQILRSCRDQARLCARRTGAGRASSGLARTLGRFGASAWCGRKSACRHGLDWADAQTSGYGGKATRCTSRAVRSYNCRRTSLFRLTHAPAASALFRHLGRAGIFVRAFPEDPNWLRFGLPANAGQWRRLNAAMASFRDH